MYLPGHVGVTLLVYAPLAYRLVRVGRGRRAAAGAATLLLLACAPDVDSHVAFLTHRGLTHTVWAAVVVGAAVGAAWWWLTPRRGLERDEATAFGFLVGTISVLNHLVGDAINKNGVQPLAPLSDHRIAFDLVAAGDPAANLALVTAGTAALLAAVGLGRQHQWTIVDDAGADSAPPGSGEPTSVPVRDGRHARRADGGRPPADERTQNGSQVRPGGREGNPGD